MKKITLLSLSLYTLGNLLGAGIVTQITLNDRGTRRNPFCICINRTMQDFDTALAQPQPNRFAGLQQTDIQLDLLQASNKEWDNASLAQAIEDNTISPMDLEQALQLWFYRNWNTLASILPYKEDANAPHAALLATTDVLPNGNTITYTTINQPRQETRFKTLGHGADKWMEACTVIVVHYITIATIRDKDNAPVCTLQHDSGISQQSYGVYADGTIFINGTYYRPGIAEALAKISTSAELAAVVRDPNALTLVQQRRRCSMM